MTGRERTLLERLASLETGQLSDVLDEAGVPNTVLSSALKPVGRPTRIVGIAVCARGEPIVRTQAPRRLPEPDALDRTITPGCVLLIETGGYVAGSCVGGLMAFSFKRSGCCGLIVDGAVRDAAEIEELGLATWSRELTPVNGSRRWSLVEIGRPIRMPGQGGSPVEVAPGDYVVGDADGVVIVPAAVAESIVADAEELARIERKIADELRAGGSRGEVFKRNPRFAHVRGAI
jgi:4-hydroxy-4-methyl-2-oxoglutarate aldolase